MNEAKKLVPNPLDHFPARQDVITKTFVGLSRGQSVPNDIFLRNDVHSNASRHARAINKESSRGVKHTSKSFSSSSTIQLPKIEGVLLDELSQSRSKHTHGKYVLVEESQLSELSKFESLLRQDGIQLASHNLQSETASLSLPQVAEVHIPVPAARAAVHNVCEAEMRKLAAAIAELNATWTKFSKDNHYNKPHLFLRESYLDRAPLGQRAMKLRVVNEAAQNWLQRKERDTMGFEDEMSALVGKYVDAQIRRRDYDRYYVLACRYGYWSANKYYRDSRPGRRYWKLVTLGALKFQKLWCRYWAITRLRRYRSARAIQTCWRCSHHYHLTYPLIKLRVKYGKRSVMKYYWIKWHEYNHLCRRIKVALRLYMASWKEKCFLAWRDWYQEKTRRKNDVLRRFIMRMKNLEVAGIFMQWVNYVARRKRSKLYMKRLLQCPHFEIWHQYTLTSKKNKRRSKAATLIQAGCRMRIHRSKLVQLKDAVRRVEVFGVYVIAHFIARTKRNASIASEFIDWRPEEERRRDKEALEIEKRRIIRRGQIIQEKEQKAVSEMKKHWRSVHGRTQLKELRAAIKGGSYETDFTVDKKKSRWEAEVEVAKKEMMRRCKYLAKVQETHEFQVKYPPVIQCPDPRCKCVFISERLYCQHVRTCELHTGIPEVAIQASASVDADESAANAVGVAPNVPNAAPAVEIGGSTEDPPQSDTNLSVAPGLTIDVSAAAVEAASGSPAGSPTLGDLMAAPHSASPQSNLMQSRSVDSTQGRPDSRSEASRGLDVSSHILKPSFPFCDLHIQLRNHRGVDLLRSYFIRMQGIDSAVNCLDLWLSIQEWRKVSIYSEHYKSKALTILETYLCNDCSRPLQLPSRILGASCASLVDRLDALKKSPAKTSAKASGKSPQNKANGKTVDHSYLHNNVNTSLDTIVQRLTNIKDGDNSGFFESSQATVSLLRYVFGLGGFKYNKWTDDFVIAADLFDHLEWNCFLKVYEAVVSDDRYGDSDECKQYQAIINDDEAAKTAALLEDYKEYRLAVFLDWAVQFRKHELSIRDLAIETVCALLEEEAERLVMEAMKIGVHEVVVEISYEEQKQHERLAATVDEALDWVCFDATEAIYEHYVSLMLTTMWTNTELRKGMLQYSGLLKDKKTKLLKGLVLTSKDVKDKAKEDAWFAPFFEEALKLELETIPLEASVAVTRIQKMARGMIGRRLARREFAGTFVKKYDKSAQACYYINYSTGTSSWVKPALHTRLFPDKTW